MEKKFTIKRPRFEDNSEKHYRYSIRKFNVGVASVAISAFILFGGGAVISADSISDTTSSDQVAVEQVSSDSTADSQTVETTSDATAAETADSITEADDVEAETTDSAVNQNQTEESEAQNDAVTTIDTADLDVSSDDSQEQSQDDSSDTATTAVVSAARSLSASLLTTSSSNTSDDVALRDEWNINVEPTEESKQAAEDTAAIKNVDSPTSVTSTSGTSFDTTGIYGDPDTSRYTIAIYWLGNPFDSDTDTDEFGFAIGDYNERNGTEYYVTVSVPADGSNASIQYNLVDRSSNEILETILVTPDDAAGKTFSTLTALADTDLYHLNYRTTYDTSEHDDGTTTVYVGLTAFYNSDFDPSTIVDKGYSSTIAYSTLQNSVQSAGGTQVGTNNQGIYIVNTTSSTHVGTVVNHFTTSLPTIADQYNHYWLVDYEQYQDYLNSGATYLSQRTHSEDLLAEYTQVGLTGQYYYIAGALEFDNYELVETPQTNASTTEGILVGDYQVGQRILQSSTQNVKRIFTISEEDGTGYYEFWILDPTKEGYESYYGDTTTIPGGVTVENGAITSKVTDDDHYTLMFVSEEIPPGQWNTLYGYYNTEAINQYSGADYSVDEDGNPTNHGSRSGYAATVPDADGVWEYGRWHTPIISTISTGTAADGRIGGITARMINDNDENTQNVNWYYVEKGSVIVHYEDVDGNVIAVEQVDTDHGTSGSSYDTTDLKPTTITADDGTIYYLVEEDSSEIVNGVKQTLEDDSIVDNKLVTYVTSETGDVVAATDKHITYVYQKGGSVVVRYHAVDSDGNVIATIADEVTDTAYASNGTAYDTTDYRPTTITTSDGKVYQLVSVNNTNPHAYTDGDLADSDDTSTYLSGTETGSVTAEKTTVINYYYEEVLTNVNVHYFAVDSDGNVIGTLEGDTSGITKTSVEADEVDTSDAEQGTAYDTTDLRPDTIKDADGVTWKRVDISGTNSHAYTDGDDETGETAAVIDDNGDVDNTKDVNYYYEVVTGDVVVDYYAVDKDGNVIGVIADEVVDTQDGNIDDPYDTTDHKPDYITKDGVTYKRVDLDGTNPHAYTDGDDETGTVAEGTKTVNYYYEVVTGDVVVDYYAVDKDGNVIGVIADEVIDTQDGNIDDSYDTTDHKPDYITKDGVTYKRVDLDGTNPHAYTDGDDESGTVAEGTKTINYYYEAVTGDVVVDYYAVDKDGNVIGVIADEVVDTQDGNIDDPYDTTDHKPDYITKDGVTYKRVDLDGTNPHAYTDGDDESGTVAEGTKTINYYYEVVTGDVNVHYFAVDSDGNVITFDDGQPLAEDVVDTKDGNIDDPYDTTDHKPDYIVRVISIDDNGDEVTETYKRVDLNGTNPHAYTDGDDETGTVAEGVKDVNYYYEHVTGDVYVHYYAVDKDGNRITFDDGPLAESQVDTREGKIDSDYDTTDLKPDYITKDGVTYKRVDLNGTNPHTYTDGDDEIGKVTEEDKNVNYYYEAVTGNVEVHYHIIDKDGNVVVTDAIDPNPLKTDENIDVPYDSTSVRYPTITVDGKTYKLVVDKTDGDPETGTVEEGTKKVNYYYELVSGDVVVDYYAVDKDGNVIGTIADEVIDTQDGDIDDPYDTTDHKPDYITKDGVTYKRVDLNGTNPHAYTDGDDETGTVAEGTKTVNYYYEAVTGNVEVHYHIIDKDGNVIVTDAVDPNPLKTDENIDVPYDSTPVRYPTITVDGKTYELVVDKTDGDLEVGTVKEGTQVIHYYYREVVTPDTPTPTPEDPTTPPTPEDPTPDPSTPETPTEPEPKSPELPNTPSPEPVKTSVPTPPEVREKAVAKVKEELPKTNSASLSGAGIAGILSILASFGLAGKGRRRQKRH